jgi:signal peptidase II
VRNNAVAFSLGHNLPEHLRRVFFIILPLVVLTLLVVYYFKSQEFTRTQRWAVYGHTWRRVRKSCRQNF